MMKILFATTLLYAAFSEAKVHFVTKRNYMEKTYEKTVVLLFYSNDKYSKEFLPDFQSLAREYRNEEEILFGKVNCNGNSKELCTSVGVSGYPSVYYGNPHALKRFKRGRTLEANLETMKETLELACWPSKPEYCTEEEIELYSQLMERSVDDLGDEVVIEKKKIFDAEQFVSDEKAKMKERFDVERAERDAIFDNSDYWLAKATLYLKKSEGLSGDHDEL